MYFVQPNPLGAVSEGQVDRKVEMINDRKAEAVSDDSDWAELTNAVNTTRDGFELVLLSNVEYTEKRKHS